MSHLRRFITVQKTARINIWMGNFKCQRKTFSSSSMNRQQYQTMANVKEKVIKIINADSPFLQQSQKLREKLLQYLPKSQEELPARKMKDSFDNAIIPLSTNQELREKYITSHGTVRVGRLMEDLDLFAVWCTVKHIYGDGSRDQKPFPYVIVTIRVEEIQIFWSGTQVPLLLSSFPSTDIKLSGHVCWVGKSSLEVQVSMDQLINGKWNKILKALVLMAARNPLSSGPAIVNPVVAETADEKALILAGEERRKKRTHVMKQALLSTVPTTEESGLIHKLFTKTIDPNEAFLLNRILPPKSKWMHEATLSTLIFCHPEHRNVYDKIFGGFLIRQAVELSWAMAVTYGMSASKLIHISDISFHSPVDVGSILKMYACVTFTEKQYIQVFVYAEAYTLSNPSGKSTNSFHFTYDSVEPVDQVYPSTYLDAMRFIDGRRRFLEIKHKPA